MSFHLTRKGLWFQCHSTDRPNERQTAALSLVRETASALCPAPLIHCLLASLMLVEMLTGLLLSCQCCSVSLNIIAQLNNTNLLNYLNSFYLTQSWFVSHDDERVGL